LDGKFWGQRKVLEDREETEILMGFIDKVPDDGSASVK
jgi:hypothetical protein